MEKATSEAAALKKTQMETSVQFANVLLTKVVRCGNAYSEKPTKGVFINDVQAKIQSAVRVL